MRTDKRAGRRTAFVLILIFVLLAAGTVTAGSLYYRNYERHYRAGIESQLSAVADLKVGELVEFRKERLGDAAAFRSASFSAQARRFLENPRDMGARRQLQAQIDNFKTHYQYDRVFLLDAKGAERISAPAGPRPVAAVISRRWLHRRRVSQSPMSRHREPRGARPLNAAVVGMAPEAKGPFRR